MKRAPSKEVFTFESVFDEHAQTTQLAMPTQIDLILPSVMADQVARAVREDAARDAAANLVATRHAARSRAFALVPGVAVLATVAAAFFGSFGQGDAHASAELLAAVEPTVAQTQDVAVQLSAATGATPPAAQETPAPTPAEAAPAAPAAANEPIEISITAPVIVRAPAAANVRVDTRARYAPPSNTGRLEVRPPQPAFVAATPPPKAMTMPAPAPAQPTTTATAKAKSDADFEAAARAAAQASKQLDSTLR